MKLQIRDIFILPEQKVSFQIPLERTLGVWYLCDVALYGLWILKKEEHSLIDGILPALLS